MVSAVSPVTVLAIPAKWSNSSMNHYLYQASSRNGRYNLTRFGSPEPGLLKAITRGSQLYFHPGHKGTNKSSETDAQGPNKHQFPIFFYVIWNWPKFGPLATIWEPLSQGLFTKTCWGGLMQKGGLKFFDPCKGGPEKKKNTNFPVKLSLLAFLWDWPIIFMVKRGGLHFFEV